MRPVLFSDVDPMGIVWFGRYPLFIECGGGMLCNRTGLGYEMLHAVGLLAPIAKMEIDYVQPLRLGEEITITASMIWTGSAKLCIEYVLTGSDGGVRAYAATTQLFVDAATGQSHWVTPPTIEAFNEKWQSGGFACLQEG
jgi:acyl-CoA thioester hydrolase